MSKFLLPIIFLITTLLSSNAKEISKKEEYVVVLHGIARSSDNMKELASFLGKNGYEVINIDYPSTSHKIEELTDIVNLEMSKKIVDQKKINFVGYSMGGLIVRALIHKFKYKNLGRVVQLAPPNQGSEVADFLKDFWPYKKIYGPAGQQLITNQKDFDNIFGIVNYELGIIAGNSSIDPISSFIIKGDDDGKVAIEKTKLEGMKDHIIIDASHTFFPTNKKVQKQALFFLKNGKFQHQTP